MFTALLVTLAVAQPLTPSPAPTLDETTRGGWTVSAEYVLWWLRRGTAPPILTTSSPASRGLLGRPDTLVVYGDETLETRHDDRFLGTRFAVDWLDPSGTIGVEGRAFFLERDSTYFTLKHRSDRLLALSYVDATTGQQASEIIAGPDPQRGMLWGGFVGYSRIELFGQEANVVLPLFDDPVFHADLLLGARFLQMRDRYHHTATSFVLPEKAVLYGVVDNYRIHNAFYGGQIGLRTEYRWNRLFAQLRGAVALGCDDQLVRTFGNRVHHTPQARVETTSGLFVQPGNTGRFRRRHFDGVGEVAANVGCQITDWLRGYVGYTFLYWADPMRAANQVDRVVDPRPGTTGTRPGIPFEGDPFWAQGFNVGLEARW